MKLCRIAAEDFASHIPAGSGIYRVHCFADDSYTSVMPVQRVLAVDQQGVLYIGKGVPLIRRVTDLKKSILPIYRGKNHICGRRYKNMIYTSFVAQFPAQRLCVSFELTATPERDEQNALIAYATQFGELPPLNRLG